MNRKKSDVGTKPVEVNSRFLDQLAAARGLIERSASFVISVHVRPDPDAIGSALALARGLRQLGKDAMVISQDAVPEICSYLPDASTVVATTDRRDFDAGIICDANALSRIGSALEVIESAKSLLIVDHHLPEAPDSCPDGPPGNFSETVCLIEPRFAATAEIVHELLHGYAGVRIEEDMARQLMAGIVGDTGAFRFPNANAVTFYIAAGLALRGGSASEAARQVYDNRPLVNARLLGVALLATQVSHGGKVVWSRITSEDFERFGASDDDTDSIVNQLAAIQGAEVAALFRQAGPGCVRVSLRSRNHVDMNQVAGRFGGGGHSAAAGCTLEMPLREAESAVLAEVGKWMES